MSELVTRGEHEKLGGVGSWQLESVKTQNGTVIDQ